MRDLQWLKIENKINFDICIFTYKICNNMLPDWLFSFPANNEINTRNTRQSSRLYVARKKTDIGARAISIKGPRLWNTIPSALQSQPTLVTFRVKLKKYFLEV